MFASAKWIARSAALDAPAPLLRKGFALPGKVRRASLSICGVGLFCASINGKPVTENRLEPPLTRFDATLLYPTYDVTALLTQGENAIGVMLGNGWYNYAAGGTWDLEKATWRHHPKLLAQLDVTLEDGTTVSVVTNTSWRAQDGPITYNGPREGERYDARLERPGWDAAGYDDSDWYAAILCPSPGGELRPVDDDFPPIRVVDTLPAKRLSGSVYDFGVNISGWVRLRVNAAAGTQIYITYAERLREDGAIDNQNINTFTKTGVAHADRYIAKGGGEEIWEPRFVYHGFRYAHIAGLPADAVVEARVVHTDFAVIGSFTSSDPMLNRIHAASCRSTLTNYHGIPTDCPHREQNGWTGDALCSCDQALFNFDMKAAYRKWLRDFKDVQRPSGQLPGIIPTSAWGYNWGSGPAWDSALIQIPYRIYESTGDASILAQMWENMERYMGFMDSMAEEDCCDYGLGDWLAPEDCPECPSRLTDTALYAVNARVMAACAEILGACPRRYAQTYARVRAAFRREYVRGGLMTVPGQTALACALYQGMLEPEEIPVAAKELARLIREKDDHFECGLLGMKYIFAALSENGYADLVYRCVVNPTYPSYADWMNKGMTTLCEDWEMRHSLNHHMFSEVDAWFYRYVAGIRVAEPGFRRARIRPCFLEGVEFVRARHRGIEVSWDQRAVTVTSDVPATLEIGDRSVELKPGTHRVER